MMVLNGRELPSTQYHQKVMSAAGARDDQGCSSIADFSGAVRAA